MGVEYKIKIESNALWESWSLTRSNLDAELRSVPGFAEFEETFSSYYYREGDNRSKMPNAEIRIESDGLYLCDYGMSRSLFGLIVTDLISRYGSIQIMDYELSENIT
jgi:hypothetical protein